MSAFDKFKADLDKKLAKIGGEELKAIFERAGVEYDEHLWPAFVAFQRSHRAGEPNIMDDGDKMEWRAFLAGAKEIKERYCG